MVREEVKKMKTPCIIVDKVPKKIRVEIVIDTEKNLADVQMFDATEKLLPGQEIVTGTDELNAKIKAGYKLVDVLRPRVPSLSYLIEPAISDSFDSL